MSPSVLRVSPIGDLSLVRGLPIKDINTVEEELLVNKYSDDWQEVLGTIDEQDCQYWLDGKEVKKEDVIKAPKWVSPY
jgi:hypothetical protein